MDRVAPPIADVVGVATELAGRVPHATEQFGVPGCIHRALDAASDADWQAVAAALIADALAIEAEGGLDGAPTAATPVWPWPLATGAAREGTCARRSLQFIDYRRESAMRTDMNGYVADCGMDRAQSAFKYNSVFEGRCGMITI